MSFMNFIAKLMQKLIPAVDYDPVLYTYEELLESKANGVIDEQIDKYIILYEKGEHPNQIEEAKQEELYKLRFENDLPELNITISDVSNPTDLSKIKPHLSTNINPDKEIIKTSLKGVGVNDDDFIEGQLALTSVVQAAPAFWDTEGELGYAAFVLTYVKKGEYMNIPKFLKLLSSMLNDFRDEDSCPNSVSKEMKKLYKDLNSPKSEFHVFIDQSLLDYYGFSFEGKKVVSSDIVVATTFHIDSEKDKLPNKCFPTDGIVPMICLLQKRKRSDHAYFKFVDGAYYSA